MWVRVGDRGKEGDELFVVGPEEGEKELRVVGLEKEKVKKVRFRKGKDCRVWRARSLPANASANSQVGT